MRRWPGSVVVSHLDEHDCQDAQESDQQEAKSPFVELLQKEKFHPVHL